MLLYKITELDFHGAFPVLKVLQCNYESINKPRMVATLRKHVTKCKGEYSRNEISIEQINTYLYSIVDEIKLDFPKDFVEEGKLGWYSKELLAELYLAGKIDLNGQSSLEIEAIRREKLEEKKRLKEEEEERSVVLMRQRDKEKREKQIERENNRQKVVVGMEFTHKHLIEEAYEECKPPKFLKKNVDTFLNEYLSVERVKKEGTGMVWVVIEVKQEGGRKWV